MTFFCFFAARLKPCPDEGESQRRSQNRPREKRRGRYIRQIERQDAAFGLGALKRRPYKDRLRGKSQNRPREKRRGRYIRQIQRQDAAFGLGALKRRPYKDGLRKKLRAQTRLGGCALLN